MLTAAFCAAIASHAATANTPATRLQFDAKSGVPGEISFHDGSSVKFTAYERLYFVTNVEDSTYQYMNVYVPEGANQKTPIFLRTYVGGYMASKASAPQPGDATGRALKEGYVVAIPGSRGRNSVQGNVYTGRAPKAILDLKAAIRYLRHFDRLMPGNAERIITDGTSAGGAMSSLMGATGNSPAYEPLLKAMGAAKARDDVFASVVFCPITDLDHADMAYEWLYNGADSRQKGDAKILAVSNELKAGFPGYLDSLKLKDFDGTPISSENYLAVIKREIIRSAQIAKNAGADIPDSLGFTFSKEAGFGAPPVNGGVNAGPQGARANRPAPQKGEYIVDLDMGKYLNYVVSTQALKTAPAFDTKGVENQGASGENEEFGDSTGNSVNFTPYAAAKNGSTVSPAIEANRYLLNPMNFISDKKTKVAPHWYIRHGARDRDTGFSVPLNLALKLKEHKKDVNFLLAWNRPHSGDYALDELFDWIRKITN